MLRVLKEKSSQCKKKCIRTGSKIKLFLANDFLACLLILSLDISSCLCLFFFSFFFYWIILRGFQGGKPAAGTNFPDYVIFPLWTRVAISYVPSQEAALPALPWPTAVHPRLSGEDAPGPSGLQAEQAEPQQRWGSGDLWSTPSSLCSHSVFCPAFFLEVEKLFWIPLTSVSGFFLFKKEQVQSWTSRALCLGAVILRGTCLALNDFSS